MVVHEIHDGRSVFPELESGSLGPVGSGEGSLFSLGEMGVDLGGMGRDFSSSLQSHQSQLALVTS